MAESYSVKARLSATDNGFTSTFKSANSAIDTLGQKIKSGFTFGILTGIGQQAFNTLCNGARDLISEIDESNAAWKTFESNLKMLGNSDKEIDKAKKALQKYAQQTVYSSSDMATTYAQLSAVGIKNVDKLVTGFGGLASAAENPQQAMKTLSQQATQMAAKPKVAWEDFKLMLEQTPAGIAAVAKQMGMSTSELVTAVQAGTVKTTDFFNAIQEVGNNDAFSQMATEAKTVGQAMDGLKETLGNKLGPAFTVLSDIGISAVDKIAAALEGIDGQKIADNVTKFIEQAQPYWEEFKDIAIQVGNAIKVFGEFLLENSDTISKALPYILAAVAAYKGFKFVNSVVPGMVKFAGSITSMVSGGISGLVSKLFGVSAGQQACGQAASTSATQMIASAKAFMMIGAGVLLVSVGFALLAQSAIALSNAGGLAIGVMAGLVIGLAAMGLGMALLLKMLAPMGAQLMPVATAMLAMGAAVLLVSAGFALLAYSSIQLANSGGLAIGIMVGMVAAVALLAAGAALLGPALTAGAVGFIAFGAAIVLVGVGAVLAATSLAILSAVLPTICTYGLQGSLAIAALGASMLIFGAGALVAGAGAMVAGAGLIVLGAGAIGATAGILAFGVGILAASVSVLAMEVALKAVESSMNTISKSAKTTSTSLESMKSSISIVESGLDALGSKAKSAMKSITSAFDDTASKAKSSGEKVGNNFNTGMTQGLAKAPSVANAAVKATTKTLNNGVSSAKSAGSYISKGFANGMLSQLSIIEKAAAKMAAAAEKAIKAKAKIASPSKVADKLGAYYGAGYEGGIESKYKDVWNAAKKLVSIPRIDTPNLSFAYAGGMSDDYNYYRDEQFNITVVSELDGKEVGRNTAKYTKEEIDKMEKRENRKNGKV